MRRVIVHSPRRLKGAIALATLAAITAGCSAANSGGPTSTTVTPASSSTTTTTSPLPASSTTTTGAAGTTAASSGASKLSPTAAVKSQLEAAHTVFVNNQTPLAKLQPSDVSIRSGTLFYAVDHKTGTYWAVAAFTSSTTLNDEYLQCPKGQSAAAVACGNQAKFAVFQDSGAAPNVLSRSSSGTWTDSGSFLYYQPADTCAPGVPTNVLAAWGMSPGNCHFPLGT